jgi:condensin complex subunit 2
VPETDAGEQDLLAATQGQTRRVRPETVNYAKRAKRVDVRKLKENIWKGLDIVIAKTKLDDDKEDDESMVCLFSSSPQPKREEVNDYNEQDIDETPGPQPTDPNESRQFGQVISGLQKSYPKDKMEEISTSFCFICLLHLANEQGLKLESDADKVPQDTIIPDDDEDEGMDGEVPEGDKKIGNIWDIKVGYLQSSFNFRG